MFLRAGDFSDPKFLPRVANITFVLSTVLNVSLGFWLSQRADISASLSSRLPWFFDRRLSDYEMISPETIPYFVASVFVSVPVGLIFLLITVLNLESCKPIPKIEFYPRLKSTFKLLFFCSLTILGLLFMPLVNQSGNAHHAARFLTLPMLPVLLGGLSLIVYLWLASLVLIPWAIRRIKNG